MATPSHSIPLSDLIPPKEPLRGDINPDALDELASSMTTVGQLQEIVVQREGDKYRIVAGHRRYLAARKAGFSHLRAHVLTKVTKDSLLLMVAENSARENLTPLEEANGCNNLVNGLLYDVDQVARAFGKSRPWVEKRLEIYTWPPDIKDAVHRGNLTIAAAGELARVTDPAYRAWLTEEASKNGCTYLTARGWRQEWEARGQPTLQVTGTADHPPIDLPPPAAGLECSSCGTLTRIDQLKTLHVCPECLKPGEEARQ